MTHGAVTVWVLIGMVFALLGLVSWLTLRVGAEAPGRSHPPAALDHATARRYARWTVGG